MNRHIYYITILFCIQSNNASAMEHKEAQLSEQSEPEASEDIEKVLEEKKELEDAEPKSRLVPWSQTRSLRRVSSCPDINKKIDFDNPTSPPFPSMLGTLRSLADLDNKDKKSNSGDFFDPSRRAHNLLQHQQKNEAEKHFLIWYKKGCDQSRKKLEVKAHKIHKIATQIEDNIRILEKASLEASAAGYQSSLEADKRSAYKIDEGGIGSYMPNLASLGRVAPTILQAANLLKGYFPG